MQLIQILLPLYDQDGKPFHGLLYDRVKKELTQTFGGLTAYTRSPASGTWKDGGKIVKEDIYVYEVMTSEINKEFWKVFKSKWQKIFQQEELIIRTLDITLL
ncbi:MAG: hypothetical protein JWM14_2712 [Chitinophagaceae bacterium]|nr:hypothetical protein [Chitinophagaceae bacterium]